MPLLFPMGFYSPVVGGGGGGTSYLLDTLTNAPASAYSLRKLRSAYSGAAIRVRRSSDNTEQDIGFDGSGNLDTAALASFVGANSGYVTTIYDQKGASNFVQATQSAQPRIVNAGTNETLNGKIAINFDGSSQWMQTATQVIPDSGSWARSVVGTTNFGRGADGAGNGWSIGLNPNQPNYGVVFTAAGVNGYNITRTASGQGIFTEQEVWPIALQAYSGGSSTSNTAVSNYTLRSSTIREVIGLGGSTAAFIAGKFQEDIMHTVFLGGTADATAIMNDQRTYWNVP